MTTSIRKAGRPLALSVSVLAAATVLSACVGGQVDAPEEDEATGGEVDAEADIVLRFAHVYDAQHPVETCGVPAIQESLAGSGVTIESFPSAQLGTEAESLEQVSDGSLDIAVAGPSFLGVYYADAAVLDGAYLFEDVDDFNEHIDSDQIQAVWDGLHEESGLLVEGSWYYGTRHVTSNTPVNTPDDLAGMKIRVADAPLYLINIGAMGGTGTPMALGEVYTALQQGTVDAQENPIPTIASSGFQEVQDYINLTGHSVQSVQIVTSDSVLDQLSDEQREAFSTAVDDAAAAVQECLVTQEEDIVAEWEAEDTITVNRDVDVAAFSSAVQEQLPGEVPWGDLYLEIAGE